MRPLTVLVRRPVVRAVLVTVAVTSAVAAILVVGAQRGHPAQQVRLLSGAAWLASWQVGQATLLDGSSAEVAAQLQVASRGDTINIVQQGATAYTVNQKDGTIRRIDGATFQLTQPVAPIPDARGGLTAFASSNTVYALDTQRGILTATDPHTLAARGQPSSLAARLETGSATLDGEGRLWLVDSETGDLISINGDRRSPHPHIVEPGHNIITMAGEVPVIVNQADRKATVIDPETGQVRNTINLDLRADDTVAISASPHAQRLYLVASRGIFAICDLAATACDGAVPLDAAGSELGPAVEAGNRLFIPDYTTGQVWVIDLTGHNVITKTAVLTPPAPFQLLTRDGLVFYNDPATERAGIIDINGGVHKVAKYDPKNPDKGLNTPPTDVLPPTDRPPAAQPTPPSQPPTQPPPNQPPAPPPNQPPSTRPPPVQPPPGQPPPRQPTNQPPSTAPPTSSSPTTNPQLPLPGLGIKLSDTTPEINQNITLRVEADSGPPPTAALWDFGDTSTGSGVTTSHPWTTARTYQVSVRATLPDGRQATASLSVAVSPPATVDVPDVLGQTEAAATATLTGANLTPAVQQLVDNNIPAGIVFGQYPVGGATAAPGSTVTLMVSSGPRTPIDLLALASSATWRNGNGVIPFPGTAGDPQGGANVEYGTFYLEDGSAPNYITTHPEWVTNGLITGTYTLPSPIIANDHFRTTVGFVMPQNPPSAGDADFSVSVIMPNSTVIEITRVHDIGRDGIVHPIDVDLTPYVGATRLILRVDAGATAAQDWASWVAPRIEK